MSNWEDWVDYVQKMTDDPKSRSLVSSIAESPQYYLILADGVGMTLRTAKSIVLALFSLRNDIKIDSGTTKNFKYEGPDTTLDGPAERYSFALYVAYSLHVLLLLSKLHKNQKNTDLVKINDTVYEPITLWFEDLCDVYKITTFVFSEAETILIKLIDIWSKYTEYGEVDNDEMLKFLSSMQDRINVPHNLTQEDRAKGGINSGILAKHPKLKTNLLKAYRSSIKFGNAQETAAEGIRNRFSEQLKKAKIKEGSPSVSWFVRNSRKMN